MGRVLIIAVCVVGSFSGTARAEKKGGPPGVGFDQRLDAQVPLDAQFADETGKTVRLGDYFGSKPVILILAYYRCPRLCTLVLNATTQAMHEMQLTPGTDYQIVTVSFDPRETPDLAAQKKKNYVAQYGGPGGEEGWHFLTGKEDDIQRLCQSVGFRYVYDAVQQQYIHASGVVVLTPTGKVSRYFFGIHFSGRDMRLSLVEASGSKIGSPSDEVLLYCYHFDPGTGKYTANVMNLIRAGGALTVALLAGLIFFLMRRQRGVPSRPAPFVGWTSESVREESRTDSEVHPTVAAAKGGPA